jgi:hypothetical protein
VRRRLDARAGAQQAAQRGRLVGVGEAGSGIGDDGDLEAGLLDELLQRIRLEKLAAREKRSSSSKRSASGRSARRRSARSSCSAASRSAPTRSASCAASAAYPLACSARPASSA